MQINGEIGQASVLVPKVISARTLVMTSESYISRLLGVDLVTFHSLDHQTTVYMLKVRPCRDTFQIASDFEGWKMFSLRKALAAVEVTIASLSSCMVILGLGMT